MSSKKPKSEVVDILSGHVNRALEALRNGTATKAEWDELVEQLRSSGRIAESDSLQELWNRVSTSDLQIAKLAQELEMEPGYVYDLVIDSIFASVLNRGKKPRRYLAPYWSAMKLKKELEKCALDGEEGRPRIVMTMLPISDEIWLEVIGRNGITFDGENGTKIPELPAECSGVSFGEFIPELESSAPVSTSDEDREKFVVTFSFPHAVQW